MFAGLREAGDVDVGGCVGAARQQGELDFPGDLELAFERESFGDFEQHQQVDEDEAQHQRESAVCPDGQEHADI